jgi:predicted nucleic acid-binding protein
MTLLDTTVLVDALRGKTEALRYLDGLPEQPAVSAVTVAELYVGVRPEEEEALEQFLSIFRVFPVDAKAAVQAGYWRRDYGPSHGTSLTDAMIAATAAVQEVEIATHNVKHFLMVDVTVPY